MVFAQIDYTMSALPILPKDLLISSMAFLPTHFISSSSPFFFFSRSSTYKMLFFIKAFLVLSLKGSASIGIVFIFVSSGSFSLSKSNSSYSVSTDLSIYTSSKINNLAYEANTSQANINNSFGDILTNFDLISNIIISFKLPEKSSITSSTSYFTESTKPKSLSTNKRFTSVDSASFSRHLRKSML